MATRWVRLGAVQSLGQGPCQAGLANLGRSGEQIGMGCTAVALRLCRATSRSYCLPSAVGVLTKSAEVQANQPPPQASSKLITYSPYTLDILGLTRIVPDFPPQAAYAGAYGRHVALFGFVGCPDPLQQLLQGDCASQVVKQLGQNVELLLGESDLPFLHPHAARVVVDGQVLVVLNDVPALP